MLSALDHPRARPGYRTGGPTHLVVIQVENVDAHHVRAVAGGATILVPPTDRPWGRDYELVDPEGFVFSFHQ